MRILYHWLKRPIAVIIVVLLLIFLIPKINLLKNWFEVKPLLIDNTPLVIKEVRTIAELNTATLYKEIVVSRAAPAGIPFAAKRQIVLIIKGRVTAGIDLSRLNEVFVKDDSVSILLPKARVREVIINPTDVETFYEFGRWNNAEITELKLQARGQLLQAVGPSRLLEMANEKAYSLIENFLRAAKFTKINLRQE